MELFTAKYFIIYKQKLSTPNIKSESNSCTLTFTLYLEHSANTLPVDRPVEWADYGGCVGVKTEKHSRDTHVSLFNTMYVMHRCKLWSQ